MQKTNLRAASQQLFAREPDEVFPSFSELMNHCKRQREMSQDRWHAPIGVRPGVQGGELVLALGNEGAYSLNDWSFSQLCRLSGVTKETVNRLSPETACKVFEETMPQSEKPFQYLSADSRLRSVSAASYTRLWNSELLHVVSEFAVDFQPPQKGFNGATGLYAGDEDMFVFLIDPNGWAEIEGESFAPGFFLWNSEVGRRSVGISTFWFQAVCANHIVWDATEVMELTRKHTANVREVLGDIRRIIETLVETRDRRKAGFTDVIARAMKEKLGDDAEEAMKALQKQGISKSLAKQALELASRQGRFSVWSVVDALTRLSQREENAGDRLDADQKAASLLSLVA